MNAPVVIFTYNRPQHTQAVLNALNIAQGATNTDVYIFSDAARNKADIEKVNQVRNIDYSQYHFKSIHIVERKENIGLANNIIDGLNTIFKEAEQAIVLEDDIVVSSGFLNYMNAALSFYEKKNVFSISGYTPNVHIPTNYKYSTYPILRNCSWGWATWRNRWLTVDWNVTNFNIFIRNKKARNKFDLAGSDLSAMLLRWRMGEINSWSIRFCYAAFCQNATTIYPTMSLVRNIGADGSGSNVGNTSKYISTIATDINSSLFCPDTENINKTILLSFRRTYNCSFIRRCINHLKRWLYIIMHKK